MNYQSYPPPENLKHIVRYFWSLDSFYTTKSEVLLTSFADKYPRLIFQVLDNFEPIRYSSGELLPQTYLCGIYTQRKNDFKMDKSFSHFGVSFYPHALKSLFKVDANELIGLLPDINEICTTDLNDKMQKSINHAVRVQVISEFLLKKLNTYDRIDPLINFLVVNQEIKELTNMHGLQQKYKISERQLERKFNTFLGISPKKFQRITRFEKALEDLKNAEYNQLTSIAYNLGYSDQSHFINDFKSFSGLSPYAFLTRQKLGGDSSSFIFDPSEI